MAEVKLRYNPDAEEVELVVDNEVALTSGTDVFHSWVEDFNEKHKPVVPEPVVEEKTVDVTPEEPTSEEVAEGVDKQDES